MNIEFGASFNNVLTAAVNDLAEHGFDDAARLDYWLDRLRFAANVWLPSEEELMKQMQLALSNALKRSMAKSNTTKYHPGVSQVTIDHIKPHLRSELDRRILASADLIKLNRTQAIEKTLQRFSGWATSIPAGGSRIVDRVEVKSVIKKELQNQRYIQRRLNTDQGHKLISSVNAVIAMQSGAIAAEWHHVLHSAAYEARPEHVARSGKVFAIRGSWAMERGFMNKGAGYTDEIEMVGELVNCSCSYIYLNNLRDLPTEMLTAKGTAELERVRIR